MPYVGKLKPPRSNLRKPPPCAAQPRRHAAPLHCAILLHPPPAATRRRPTLAALSRAQGKSPGTRALRIAKTGGQSPKGEVAKTCPEVASQGSDLSEYRCRLHQLMRRSRACIGPPGFGTSAIASATSSGAGGSADPSLVRPRLGKFWRPLQAGSADGSSEEHRQSWPTSSTQCLSPDMG